MSVDEQDEATVLFPEPTTTTTITTTLPGPTTTTLPLDRLCKVASQPSD